MRLARCARQGARRIHVRDSFRHMDPGDAAEGSINPRVRFI